MTANEAKKHLELCKRSRLFIPKDDVLDISIQALEEIQQYRAIGTIEEFKALKEKNEPKKPYIQQIVKDFREHDCYECPNCDCFVGYVSECQEEHYQYIYCPNCGQKLDWQ